MLVGLARLENIFFSMVHAVGITGPVHFCAVQSLCHKVSSSWHEKVQPCVATWRETDQWQRAIRADSLF